MRYSLDAEVNGFCGGLISVALVPEDVNLAPFYEAIDGLLQIQEQTRPGHRA